MKIHTCREDIIYMHIKFKGQTIRYSKQNNINMELSVLVSAKLRHGGGRGKLVANLVKWVEYVV